MVKSCCAYGCNKEWHPVGSIKFHNFPFKRPEILEKWIEAVGRKNWTPSKWSKLCSEHFLPSDYLNRPGCYIELLKPDAVPSIFSKSSSLKLPEPDQETGTLAFKSISPQRRNEKELDNSLTVQNLEQNIKRSNGSVVTKKKSEHPVEEQDIQTRDIISMEKGIDSLTAMKLVTDLDRNLGRDSFTKSRKSRDETSQFTPSDVQVGAIPITVVPMNTNGDITNVARYNFEEICRCCVINKGEVNLFEAYFQDKSMSDLINFCTNETISSSDNLPRTICNVCMQLLISAFTFIDKFKRSQVHVRQIGRLLTGNCQLLDNETYSADDSEPSEEMRPNEKNYITSNCDSIESFKSNFRGLKNVYSQLCSVLSHNKKLLKETDQLLEKTPGDFDDEQPILYEVNIEGDETTSESILKDNAINIEYHEETAENQSMDEEACNFPDSVVAENCESSFTTIVADKKITVIPCLECPQRLLSEKAVVRHYKQTGHRMPDRFKCNICSATFALKSRYKSHMSHHKEGKSLCEICGTKITHSNLRRHLEVHSTEATNICQYCGKAFTQKTTLDYHISTKHAEKCEEILCALCGRLFRKLCDLNNHLNGHHKNENMHDKLHGCKVCPKFFVTQNSLLLHEKFTHSEEPVHQRRYNTTKKVKSKRNRKKKGYSPEKKQCPICQQGIHYAAFKAHMNMHQSIKPFKCNTCSKRFRQFAHLRSHMNLHSGNKPYKCEYCEKTFRHNSTLATHVRTHIGETLYRCPICDKEFPHSSSMKKHYLMHIKVQKQNKYKFEKMNEC